MFKTLKIASFFLFVLCNYSFLFAQQVDNPREQSFKIIDFNLSKPFENTVNSTLDFEFKLQAKKPLQDPYKYPYILHFSLYKNNQLVWKNNKEKEFYAKEKEEFFDGLVFYQIPFEDIKVKNGVQNMLLKITISYQDYTFPMNFEKEINFVIPELFAYDQQEFKVTNYRVSLDSVSYKTPGFLIRFTSKAKFVKNQIKGVKDNPFIGEYLFQLHLKDKKTNQQIDFRNSNTGLLSFNVNLLKNRHRLFIPFNELIIADTKHTAVLQLVAITKEKNKELSPTLTKEISFTQPKVHPIHFNLVKALIKEKKYDLTNILGRLFSSPKSNIGKGNPDVYWEIRTGDFVKFKSQIIDNSFTASTENCIIWVLEQDVLQLVFWDKDVFKDDWIESIQLQNPPIGILIKNTQSQTENLDLIDFSYRKK